MIFDLNSFTGSMLGEKGVIVGSSPTMGTISNHLEEVGFWLGDAHLRTNAITRKQFYVRANSEYPDLTNEQHVSELMKRGFTFCIAETVMESEIPVRKLATEKLKGDFVFFDQRHFGQEKCNPQQACCNVIDSSSPQEFTLQEYLAKYFSVQHHYSTADTVALHAFALAILGGCSTIYLSGIDLPLYESGYTYANKVLNPVDSLGRSINELVSKLKKYRPSIRAILSSITTLFSRKLGFRKQKLSIFGPDFPRIFADFQYLADISLSQGIQIYYCSENSNLRHVNGLKLCDICNNPSATQHPN